MRNSRAYVAYEKSSILCLISGIKFIRIRFRHIFDERIETDDNKLGQIDQQSSDECNGDDIWNIEELIEIVEIRDRIGYLILASVGLYIG